MDKQQIAHILEKEISSLNKTIDSLHSIKQQIIDVHQARDLDFTINVLIKHKQSLEKVIVNIVEDAKHFNPDFNR